MTYTCPLHGDYETTCPTCALQAERSARALAEHWMQSARHLAKERDEANIRLALVNDWVLGELLKHENKSRGGQMAGDSHSPRVPQSALRELAGMLEAQQGAYSYDCWIKLQQERDEAVSRAAAAENEVEGLKQIASGNGRRLDLLAKKYSGELSAIETAELAALQDLIAAVIPRVTPDMMRWMEQERDELRGAIKHALDYADGRWCEWGSRAEAVQEILAGALEPAKEQDK